MFLWSKDLSQCWYKEYAHLCCDFLRIRMILRLFLSFFRAVLILDQWFSICRIAYVTFHLLRWNHDLSSVSFDWKSVGFFRSESDKDKRLLWELYLFLWRIIWGLLVLIISTTISYARMPVQCSDTCHWISICFFRFPLRKKNLHYNNYIYFSFFLHELN